MSDIDVKSSQRCKSTIDIKADYNFAAEGKNYNDT